MDPEDKPSIDPATVNDVETARLALRWALERIHKIQEENAKAQQSAKDSAEKLRVANDLLKQKDDSLQRWQSTIKTWDAHWRDQETMEQQIAERLRKEIVVTEESRYRVERGELERHVDLLKRELADKEGQVGQLQRRLIEAVRDVGREKEREMQDLLADHAKSLEEFRVSFVERNKIQEQNLRLREREIENREKTLEEHLHARHLELERRSQHFQEEFRRTQEAELEKLRQELTDEYRGRIEAMETSNHQKIEEHRQRLEENVALEQRSLEEQYHRKEADLDEKATRRKAELEELRLRAHEEQQEWLDARQNELNDRRQRLEEEFERKRRDEESLHNHLEKLRVQYQEKEKQLVSRHEENKARLDRLIAQNQSEALKFRQNLEDELRQREQALEKRFRSQQEEWTQRQQDELEKERHSLQAKWDEKNKELLAERDEIERQLLMRYKEKGSKLESERKAWEDELKNLKDKKTDAPSPTPENTSGPSEAELRALDALHLDEDE